MKTRNGCLLGISSTADWIYSLDHSGESFLFLFFVFKKNKWQQAIYCQVLGHQKEEGGGGGKEAVDIYIHSSRVTASAPGICSSLVAALPQIGNTIDIDRCRLWKGIVLLAINDEEIKVTTLGILRRQPLYNFTEVLPLIWHSLGPFPLNWMEIMGCSFPLKSLVMGMDFKGKLSRNTTQQIGCSLAKRNYNSDKENATVLNGMGVVYRRQSLTWLGPGRWPAHEGRARGRARARERAASRSGLERVPDPQEPDATGALRRRDRAGDTRGASSVCEQGRKKISASLT